MNPHLNTPEDLTTEGVIQWREAILKTAKPVSWNTYLRHMRSLYNFGIENEWIALTKNPFAKMALRQGKEKRKILLDEQLKALDMLFANDHLLPDLLQPSWFSLALISTFRYTGIRRSQLLQLRICDIDLEKRIIILPSNINKNHNYHEIPISDKLLPHLKKVITEMKARGRTAEQQLFNINIISQHTRSHQKEMTIAQISYLFETLSKTLGFKISTHRFRHTIATQLMRNMDNLYSVKQLLGHSDLKVTLSYVEYNVEMIRDCVNSL